MSVNSFKTDINSENNLSSIDSLKYVRNGDSTKDDVDDDNDDDDDTYRIYEINKKILTSSNTTITTKNSSSNDDQFDTSKFVSNFYENTSILSDSVAAAEDHENNKMTVNSKKTSNNKFKKMDINYIKERREKAIENANHRTKLRSVASTIKAYSLANKSIFTEASIGDLINSEEYEEESESFDLNLMEFKKPAYTQDFNREYWMVHKLVRYLKTGNPTATYIALAMIHDLDLSKESIMYSLVNTGAILVLVNLLGTNDTKCQCGAMRILKEMSKNVKAAFEIVKEGGIILLINNLSELDDDVKCLAAECLANLCKVKIARKIIRKKNGIHKLITLLAFAHMSFKPQYIRIYRNLNKENSLVSVGSNILPLSKDVKKKLESNKQSKKSKTITFNNLNYNSNKCTKNLELIKSVSYALYALSKDLINHYIMLKHGIVLLLSNILKTIQNESIVFWLVALLDNCAISEAYTVAVLTDDIIEYLVKLLHQTNDIEFKIHIIGIFSKCSRDPKFCVILKRFKTYQFLCNLLDKTDNEKLIRVIATTLSGCSLQPNNLLTIISKSNMINLLIRLLNSYYEGSDKYSEETIVSVTKALNVSAHLIENRRQMVEANGIDIFVKLLQNTNREIIVNSCEIIGLCSLDHESLKLIQNLNAVRLVWSLLRNNSNSVKQSACWVLYVCIERIENFGELVRNLEGSIEALLASLRTDDLYLLAYTCAAISKIAIDNDILAVISDYGVAKKLNDLIIKYFSVTNNNLFKMFLAEAIAQCARDRKNRILFGRNGTIERLVKCLKSKTQENSSNKMKKNGLKVNNIDFIQYCQTFYPYCPRDNNVISTFELHKSITFALSALSKSPENCVLMHNEGVVENLVELIGSYDESLQTSAAQCLQNIRMLAIINSDAKILCNKNSQISNERDNKQKIEKKRLTESLDSNTNNEQGSSSPTSTVKVSKTMSLIDLI